MAISKKVVGSKKKIVKTSENTAYIQHTDKIYMTELRCTNGDSLDDYLVLRL
jgi:hypothetical protein